MRLRAALHVSRRRLIAIGVVIASCGDNTADECASVTIAQGVYGQATYYYDVGPPGPPLPDAGRVVRVLDASGGDTGQAITDADGEYAIALAPGMYRLQLTRTSDTIVLGLGEIVRADYVVDGGWTIGAALDCRER